MASKRAEDRSGEPVATMGTAVAPRAVEGHDVVRTTGVVIQGERRPLGRRSAARAVMSSVAATARLLVRRRAHQPRTEVGRRLSFADGSSAPVYRETTVDRGPTASPAVLVVEFRLRWARGAAHACFRVESVLHTPLFVGFSGFVRKLWLAHDEHGAYRGVYEWDGPALAHAYARALWRVLALVSVPGSIHYVVIPGLRLEEVLARPDLVLAASGPADWWRLASAEPATP
jgi:hypothetical protein